MRQAVGMQPSVKIHHNLTPLLMRIVITGGAGFLGSRLARALLARDSLTDARGEACHLRELVLVDVVPAAVADTRVTAVTGDLSDPALIERTVTPDTDSIFHLAAVVSGQAESEFDVGMRVNVDATRALLERCRRIAQPPKFVFISSLAVFGGPLPDPVPDDAPVTPQTSYGAQKAIGEFLVYDVTRKGYIDGRSLRLPTITVRPGKPNKAASSFASGIIREPLSGVDAICPVAPSTQVWVSSARTVIANLIVGHEAPASSFALPARRGRARGRGARSRAGPHPARAAPPRREPAPRRSRRAFAAAPAGRKGTPRLPRADRGCDSPRGRPSRRRRARVARRSPR